MITLEQYTYVMPFGKMRLPNFVAPMNSAMAEFGIDSARRQAAFIAQCAHESGEFRYMREIASGAIYEGRKDLGNIVKGDGVKFPGRGPIQITGRSNYLRCGQALGLDLINEPKLLELPEHGCRASAWFWYSRQLNSQADVNAFGAITKTINGGYNGLDSRIMYWLRALTVLGVLTR